ncbi:MAG: helix-turn-helix protein [Pelotomaculum sp. PtaU1.Bin065]|nr:MAG: helix-turn-helix protein [Pelotomaculum sp. PtaU1.Bin065]
MQIHKTSRDWLIKIRGDYTHQQIADKAGVSRSYYTEIENGDKNPSVETAKKIAGALGFEWTKFFEEKCCDMKPTGTAG